MRGAQIIDQIAQTSAAATQKLPILKHQLFNFNMHQPSSCDTFVALPPLTNNREVIFGKNSDRPQNEVQEVVYFPGGYRDSTLKCTYIHIDESLEPINAVILSKPAWMWGAEMGANDKDVVIGNEATWTKFETGEGDSSVPRLLGMDLVRLGLERGKNAEHAMDTITTLLEKYGQGGACVEDDELCYHNSFLIADAKEAWVLETSGKMWAAEKVVGYRNISNGLTITNKIHKHSVGLHERAKEMGFWDGKERFDFCEVFGAGSDDRRQLYGLNLLRQGCMGSKFEINDMFTILRHKDSRICRPCKDPFPTQGSQVSVLRPNGLSTHWFTATPDTSISLFKPFVFTPGAQTSTYTESKNEPLREHPLYTLHSKHMVKGSKADELSASLQLLEEESVKNMDAILKRVKDGERLPLENIMEEHVLKEVDIYKGDVENKN